MPGAQTVGRGSVEKGAAADLVNKALAAAGTPASPELAARLARHFRKLPTRYAADIFYGGGSSSEVVAHLELLDATRSSGAVGVAVRAVDFTPQPPLHSAEGRASVGDGSPAHSQSAASPRLIFSPSARYSYTGGKRPPTFGSSLNLTTLEEALPGSAPPASVAEGAVAPPEPLVAHELTVTARNRPRLLSVISSLLGEMGLNINEAHAFCTDDNFALDVFIVDGWHEEEADELHSSLVARLATLDAPEEKAADAVVAETKEAEVPAPLIVGDDWEIDPSRLHFVDKVAAGTFGDLFRGMYNGQEVAIKVLRLSGHTDQAHLVREFVQELAVLRKVRHKHVVQLIGACTSPPKLCIVTEFMRRGSLLDYLHRHHPLRPGSQAKLALDVAKGMDYLHR